MHILVCCPMKEERDNFRSSLTKYTKTNKLNHEFKVITCGVGKVNSAVEVSVWCNSSQFDLVCVVGYAAATPNYSIGELVVPSVAKYSDVRIPKEVTIPDLNIEYPLQGNDCTIFTADSFITAKSAQRILNRFGESSALFDMESAAICQALQDQEIPVLVLKIVSDIPQKEESGTSFNDNIKNLKDFIPIISYINMLKD